MASYNCSINIFTITERENLTGERRVKVPVGIRSHPVPLPDCSLEDYFGGLNLYSCLPFTLAGYQQFYLKHAATHQRSTSVYRKQQVCVHLRLSGKRGQEEKRHLNKRAELLLKLQFQGRRSQLKMANWPFLLQATRNYMMTWSLHLMYLGRSVKRHS